MTKREEFRFYTDPENVVWCKVGDYPLLHDAGRIVPLVFQRTAEADGWITQGIPGRDYRSLFAVYVGRPTRPRDDCSFASNTNRVYIGEAESRTEAVDMIIDSFMRTMRVED